MTVALHRQLEILRPALLRFAVLQLRNEALAEDMAALQMQMIRRAMRQLPAANESGTEREPK